MLGLHVEHHSRGTTQVARDIAEHMIASSIQSAAIVTTQPAQLHAAIRQELRRLSEQAAPTGRGEHTPSWYFSAATINKSLDSHIAVATAESFLLEPPICKTMYVTCQLDGLTLRRITGFMPPHAVVVLYEEPRK